jgi:DMSO/TMAO reductase YedYZ molybdopterin-dependent catalytic subunit/thiosulfate reductase cytochrome b subunit
MEDLGFPAWIRATHFLNIIFMSFLIRSGIEILAAHPKLYWNDDCRHGSEWARFTKKEMPKDELWTSKDEEESYSSTIAMPGYSNLGLGRHWHFLNVILWILTGLVYVALLFVDWPEWRRLVPTSWDVIPGAWEALVTYLSFTIPPIPPGEVYNPLQKLTYFAVVFLLAPFQIATGAAMSPALSARYPWYVKLFGGHQAARSFHFLGLLAFLLFTIVHVFMVVIHGFGKEVAKMVFGSEENAEAAIVITIVALFALVVLHILTTQFTLKWRRRAQHLLTGVVDPVRKALFRRMTSAQNYSREEISPSPRVNGRPPKSDTYERLAENDFKDWKLEVYGLVENPRSFSLEELRTFPTKQSQTTLHHCIQGWSYVAEWTGVPLRQIIELVEPLPGARYLVFHAYDEKSESEPDPEGSGYYYETIDFELANHPQTILAYEMNGEPLSIPHGAPVRLRVETQLGYRMVKYLRVIEFVEDFKDIGQGQGGWRDDNQYYGQGAGI